MCGYATDPRAERAYAWLLARNAWTMVRGPPGSRAGPDSAGVGTYGHVAGYRRLPHSRWV